MRAFVSIAGSSTPTGPAGRSEGAPPHLTLAFLGEVADERSDALVACVTAAVAPFPPFEITLAGYGAFPNSARPRVVFREVGEGADATIELATVARRALERDGFVFDRRPFVPHLTVLRVRRPSDREFARTLLTEGSGTAHERVRVEEVRVNSSRLDRTGATHTVIGRCPLARVDG